MFTEPKRRLVAIVAADVAGYSRLMGADEEGTLRMLNAARAVFIEHCKDHHGRIVDTAGDSVLAVFDSVVEAVEYVLAVQDQIEALNTDRPDERKLRFRVGVNLGDILEQSDGTVYGDGVNIAARVQTLSQPGRLALSGAAYDFIADRSDLDWNFLGEQEVKNILRPIRVYALGAAGAHPEPGTARSTGERQTLPSRPSIAVLPFANMGAKQDDDYFADGMTEDIITELSRFRDLMVTARNTSFSYKDQSVNVQEVADTLNVRYVLEGSIRKAGDRVRVTAQLIEAASGHHLWAERFDRKIEDVFAVQDELTQRIVSTLVGRLVETERKRARVEGDSEHVEAYDLVLRGRELWLSFNRDDNLAARGLYLQAIKLDPEYPRAYSGLAWTYASAYNEYWTDDPQGSLTKALEYAQRAVHMDPSSHSYRLCLGMVYFFKQHLEKAIECFEKAVELNVNDADSYVFLGQALSLNGEPDKAIALLDHAFEINPYLGDWPRSLYVIAYFMGERYDEACAIIRELTSPRISHCRWFAACCAMQGTLEDAAMFRDRYLEAYPDFDLEDHASRVPFRFEADRTRYALALGKAGFEAKEPAHA